MDWNNLQTFINYPFALVSPGSVYHSHGKAFTPSLHVLDQGPGVCTWIVHLDGREFGVIIILTTDYIKTSFVTNNSGIKATVIHLRHQTTGV